MEYALREGKFIIFMDGLDEVDHTVRDNVCREILSLSYQYEATSFVVSSRPDRRFGSWNEFYVAEVLPFSLPQAVDLLNKIEFDPDIKNSFIKYVKDRLFKSHQISYQTRSSVQ